MLSADTQWELATIHIRRGGGDRLARLKSSLQGHLPRLTSLAILSREVGLASRSDVRKGVTAPTH
jgi:hypothetical protein